jgi:aspartyl-tRNA(Asn)/glutamyl-tRNA(Gln) amidotransferase subunit A
VRDAPQQNLWQCSAVELAQLLRARAVSAVEIAEVLLDRIAAVDPMLHAYVTVDRDVTLGQARAAQAELDAGRDRGPLHGIPVSLKDAIDTASMRTTWGSKAFEHRRPEADAFVTRRLAEAGAVLLGKANLLEFCAGPTHSAPFGKTANPWKRSHFAGGSSSGGGAAVAAGLGPISLGTDTGGSVRNPAAFCGVAGLKPTFGRIGRSGVFELSFTLDHVGILARRVEDIAVTMAAVAGEDPDDSGSLRTPPPDYLRLMRGDRPRPTLLLPRAHFWEAVEPDVGRLVEDAIGVFRSLGYELREVTIDHAETVHRTHLAITPVDIAWRHSGMVAEITEGIGRNFRKRVAAGSKIFATEYAEAMNAREALQASLARTLKGGALLLLPGSPCASVPLTDSMATGERPFDPILGKGLAMFNDAGVPALSVPCGFTSDGLPAAIQLVGLWDDEPQVFRTAIEYEQATGWWKHWPREDPR